MVLSPGQEPQVALEFKNKSEHVLVEFTGGLSKRESLSLDVMK